MNIAPRALALAALAAPLAAGAATLADFTPPPGLYRVEVDGTILDRDHTNAVARQSTDASGETVARQYRNGQMVATVKEQGKPITQCIKAVSTSEALASLGAVAGAGACVALAPGVIQNGALVTHQKCPFGEMTYTVTRVDKITWEFRTQALLHPAATSGARMLSSAAFMKTMFLNAQKNAPTAKEREEATQALAELEANKAEMTEQAAQMDAMQPEMDKMRAEAGIAGAGGGMASTGVTRLTRIADSCAAPRK